MTDSIDIKNSYKRQPLDTRWKIVLVFAALQAIFAFGYLIITVESILGVLPTELNWRWHETLEGIAAIGMLISLFFSGFVLFQIFKREKHKDTQLQVVSGEFEQAIYREFAAWGLSESEVTVTIYMLKGFSNGEIAKLRGTSEGTIKAQANSVFRKSGLKNRSQLLAHFVEELISGIDPINNAARPKSH